MGQIRYANGTRYEGEVKETKYRDGQGKLFDQNNKIIFDGNFRNNNMAQIYSYRVKQDKKILE